MTLTLSLPLSSALSTLAFLTSDKVHTGISILFFGFSLSAIVLSRLADMLGISKVLLKAQCLSILGLLVLACCYTSWQWYVGCLCVGLGTGCYSSISRMILARHAKDSASLRRALTLFSLLLVFSPILSTHLAMLSLMYNWRLAYALMALIELALMFGVWFILSSNPLVESKSNTESFLQGYLYCLKKRIFLFNLVLVGLTISLYIKVFQGNSYLIFMQAIHLGAASISYGMASLSVCYVLGILSCRWLPVSAPIKLIRLSLCVLLLVSAAILYQDPYSLLLLLALCLSSYCLGFLVPLSTSSGLKVIDHSFGAASALFTCSFALVSAIFALVHQILSFKIIHFVAVMLMGCSIVLIMSACVLMYLTLPKKIA